MSLYIRDLGTFASFTELWAAHPEGGHEGDYATVNGVRLPWNKYTRNWGESSGSSTPGYDTQVFQGDVVVYRNLIINGTLRAHGVQQPNQGLFETSEELVAAVPDPKVGDYAFVGNGFPAEIWVCRTAGTWVDSGGTYEGESVDLSGYVKSSVFQNYTDRGYKIIGKVSPSDTPSSPTKGDAYLASEPGTYFGFGGAVLVNGQVAVFKYNGNSWSTDLLTVGLQLANNLTTNDATKALAAPQGVVLNSKISQLTRRVSDLEGELNEVNPHITGRMGIGATNEDIDTSALPEYTDQYGIVTLVLDSPGYLWVCLENDHFRVTSSGVEIPMVFVKEDGNLHCFVSSEEVKAGTLKFKVESIHPIKSDTERITITARSYAITYGDALPDFGYTANGEFEGTPEITCEAAGNADAGTYAIHISRGTVADSNAIFVDGVLVISKAALTVTAEDKFVELNGAMPIFTVVYSGFVNGENESVLTMRPTCRTNAQGTSTAGQYNIVPSGAVSLNYTFTYVNGRLSIGEDILLSWSSEQVSAGPSIGGYIDTSSYTKKTSGSYYGIVIDVDGYQGCKIKFTRASAVAFFRFAFMKSCADWTNNGAVDYSSQSGYTSLVEVRDTSAEAIIPADTKYVFVYTYSSGTNYAPGIEISGTPHSSTTMSLAGSLFTANKTIGANGVVYTGTNAKAVWCTTNQLPVKSSSLDYLLSAVALHIPSQFDRMEINIAAYTATMEFSKRYNYTALPATFELSPGECFIHIMMTGVKNGAAVEISSVPIGENDVRLTINDF